MTQFYNSAQASVSRLGRLVSSVSQRTDQLHDTRVRRVTHNSLSIKNDRKAERGGYPRGQHYKVPTILLLCHHLSEFPIALYNTF